MTIVAKLKKYVPKTPKQWAVAGLGTAAAALVADYAWRKDGSLVMQAWHKLHHGGGGAPHPHAHRGHPAHHPHAAPHAGPAPTMQTSSSMMYGGPQMSGNPVFVEPSLANPFFYEYRNYGYGHPHFGGTPHHEHYQHMPEHPMGAAPHGAPPFHHHVGAPDAEPHAPKQSRAKVPAPGAYGVVSTTPQAAGIVAGEFTTEMPCGPGLYYDAAQQRCVPVPSTPPYGWQER